MLALEKIISSFLTLPGLFILLWGIITIYLLVKVDNLPIKTISVLTFLLMFLVFTGFGVKFFLFPLENYILDNNYSTVSHYPIVVLGGGIHYNIPGEKGELTVNSLERLVKGYRLYNKLGSKLIYTGGVAVGQQTMSEADIAAEWLKDMGIAEDKIFREDKARTTYENGVYTKKWMKSHKEKRIYLVTSAVHMPRSMAVFNNLDIDFIPVISGYSYSHRLNWLDYLPNRSALTANLAAIHEWLGLVWYKINGRI